MSAPASLRFTETMRGFVDKSLAELRGLERFGRLFLGELWEIYGPRAASGDEPP
jgi:hypothetical protein